MTHKEFINTHLVITTILTLIAIIISGCGEEEQLVLPKENEIEVNIMLSPKLFQAGPVGYLSWYFASAAYDGWIINTSEFLAPTVELKLMATDDFKYHATYSKVEIFRNVRPGEKREVRGILELSEKFYYKEHEFELLEFTYTFKEMRGDNDDR